MREVIRDSWAGLLDLLFPPKCQVCGEIGDVVICSDCLRDFAPLPHPLCQRCGQAIFERPSELCIECETLPRYFHSATAAGRFDGALRQAILRLKYEGRRSLAGPLGDYLAQHLREEGAGRPPVDLIIPIPLYPSRLRYRGFNQSTLLSRAASVELDAPIIEVALRRTRNTRPQAQLKASERASNMRDAFAVSNADLVKDRVILLIDDVLTTLHTTNECSRVLCAAGARAVYAAGVARGL